MTNRAGRSGQVGVDEDLGDIAGIRNRADGKLRGAVEAEPAEPQDEGTENGERDVGARHRMNGAVSGIVFARTRPENKRTGQSGPAANRVNQRRTGEVGEAHFVESQPPPHCQEPVIG